MTQLPAFYDPDISYEENYEVGPPILKQKLSPPPRRETTNYKFLGFSISLPFGIPPGPLLNSRFIEAAFAWGFDVSTYKTVRSDAFPCHPFPNVLPVDVEGELHPDKTPKLVAQENYADDPTTFNITNSFGVPSKTPTEWQEDVKKAMSYVGDGQLMILSFMGTVKPDQTQKEFAEDFALAGRLAKETGVKVIEANLSCPNIGNEGLVCFNLDATEEVCKAIRKSIGDTPLILKVGYYKNDDDLARLAEIASKYAQAVAAINTLQVEVVSKKDTQALPGPNRLRSGICGAGIKWAGLEMVDKLNQLRTKNMYNYEIIGIGGVMTPEDFLEYREKGADLVQSATGTMWNPYLADEISNLIKPN
jgi:dihydroorotate dehydrogenase